MENPFADCTLCPRVCHARRAAGAIGVCGETDALRIASSGPHFGEEPCFTGSRGSGAIFFSGCSCHCLFCQNWQISAPRGLGNSLSPDDFLALARDLIRQGVHNLNFVTPDHVWPHIATLCRRLREDGETFPFLFNSSGYQSPKLIPEYARWMDIFLPDFKFADPALAHTVMGDSRYPSIALDALRLMVEAKGFLEPFDPSGTATARQGVLVRHLVLPGHTENSIRVLELLRREFGRWLPLSIMSQYTPIQAVRSRPPFHRTVTPDEYQTVLDVADSLGFENVLIQPLSSGDDFLPDFNAPQPFRGNVRPSP